MYAVGLVPAFKPDTVLITIIEELLSKKVFENIVVVNDGSGEEYADIFQELAQKEQVTVLTHIVNLGKGAALKTGMNHIAVSYPESAGLVTFDADGQHLIEDIQKIREALIINKKYKRENLILGTRSFSNDIPFRSRFGNIITRGVLRFFVGANLQDTQTGLRGITLSAVPVLMSLCTQRYDFELDAIAKLHSLGVLFQEIPISTVYIEENKSSHFNPLFDSMKIYFVFFRYSATSIATASIDYIIFGIMFYLFHSILISMIASRSVAATFQFLFLKNMVFKTDENSSVLALKYLAVLLFSSTLAYGFMEFLNSYSGISVYILKIIVETVIFLFLFILQREFVFKKKTSICEDV